MFNTRKRTKETIDTQAKLIKNRDNFIERQREENHVLYEENKGLRYENEELKDKINDLENNVEFLFNNLSKQKRELIRSSNQN